MVNKTLSLLCGVLAWSATAFAATATSVSQFGITWTFDKAYEVGQFVTGDWWVVGPVKVTAITPALSNGLNGSMINPVPGVSQGYDKRADSYVASRSVQVPANLPVNASLVSTISDPDAAQTANAVYLTTAAVLTCLPSAPPAGSFRPAYCGTTKQLYNTSQLQRQLLPKLAPVANTPAMASIARGFKRVWLDHQFEWVGGQIHPAENLPNYGRELATVVGEGALLLLLNYTDAQKESLLINLVQVGIDYYGIIAAGGKWCAGCGWPQGRKYPIVFAGFMLNESALLNVGTLSTTTHVLFGDDLQTFYVTQNDIDIAIHTDMGGNPMPNWGRYQQSQLGMPDWSCWHWYQGQGLYDVPNWYANDYRQCCTANSWTGYILACHILGLKEAWHWDAIFDYLDRYEDIEYQSEDWIRFGFSTFIKNMWLTYRSKYGCTWVLNVPHDTLSNGHLDCSKCVNNCPTGMTGDGSSGTMRPLEVTVSPNPMTNNILFSVSSCARSAGIKVSIYNESGAKVQSLSSAGQNRVAWEGKDPLGNKVRPGIYFYSITVNGKTAGGKIMVVHEVVHE